MNELTEDDCVTVLGGAIQGLMCFVRPWRAKQIVRTVAGQRDVYHRDLQYLPIVNGVFEKLRRWAPLPAANALRRWAHEDALWETIGG